MEDSSLRILLVEDNPGDAYLLKTYLAEAGAPGYELTQADRLSTALAFLMKMDFDAILLDLGLPDAQGSATFTPIQAAAPHTPILILTGLEDDAIARELIKRGAQDYLIKGRVDEYYLPRVISYAIKRKQTEEALKERTNFLDKLIESSALSTWISDGQGTAIRMNPACLEFFGATEEEMVGKYNLFQDVVIEKQGFMPDIKRVFEKGEVARIMLDYDMGAVDHVNAKNATHKFINSIFTPILDGYGKVANVIVQSIDLTEIKKAEDEINKLNAELEQRVEDRTRELHEALEKLVRHEKLAMLGQLAGSVGHELRNPLGIINNAIYYLRMVLPDADNTVKEYLGLIADETHNADKIISDLLDFSRIKSVVVELVDVSELVRGTLERFPTPENVQVTLDLPANLPAVYVDPHQMTQVLGNLVLNACQAMTSASSTTGAPKGGKLVLSAKQSTINGQPSVAIAVKDTGTGITPENMNKIFEPLFTTKPKGIGLGLAVSKKMVETNGGRIEVESEPGIGSTFTLFLPVDER